MEELLKLLTENNYTIASCESYTGGMFANEITNLSGASKVFKGSIVSYATEAKKDIVKVDEKILERDGAVSYECAYQMAKNVKELFNSDISVSFTGNAGPTTMEDKSLGLVYMGLNFFNEIIVYKLNLEGSRIDIKQKSIDFICDRIKQKIKEKLNKEIIIY